ncbi:MAG: diguanylate cyclase [Chloroflexi bacterium]|nr:diguanylate cyclase [Chloroflexota bacterium]
MRVLIADDDNTLRTLLSTLLKRAGYEVLQASDGRMAWEIWQREFVRILVTDWTMPDMDGLELIGRIRAASAPGYTYLILLTARDDRADRIAGLDSGADDYLSKPVDPGELRARLAIGERILNLETRLSESLARLEKLATLDGLTGLSNRRHFFELARREFQRSRRFRHPLTAIMLDIDHFKRVNDTHGHGAGDEVLRTLARRCQEWTTAGPLAVTISLGVAPDSPNLPDLEALLDRADAALYAAKRAGRNRVASLPGSLPAQEAGAPGGSTISWKALAAAVGPPER